MATKKEMMRQLLKGGELERHLLIPRLREVDRRPLRHGPARWRHRRREARVHYGRRGVGVLRRLPVKARRRVPFTRSASRT